MEVGFSIDKGAVMNEVALTTAYTGAKMVSEDVKGSFERVSTVDADGDVLERFWGECCADVCRELMGLVTQEWVMTGDDVFVLRLNVSSSFNDALLGSMEGNLFSFFVLGITGKWYVYTNKSEAEQYAERALKALDDFHRKAVYKCRPKRPSF